jgi:hypothetical protein
MTKREDKFDKKETKSFNCYVEKGDKPTKEVIIEKKDKSFSITVFANKALLDLFQQKR